MKMRDFALATALVLAGVSAANATGPIRRYCHVSLRNTGAVVVADGSIARCTDGDPTCDGDGVADGACELRTSLCFEVGPGAICDPGDVRRTNAVVPPGLEVFSDLLDALKQEATPWCTAQAAIRVPTRGRRHGHVTLKMVRDFDGTEFDRLSFVCRRGHRH